VQKIVEKWKISLKSAHFPRGKKCLKEKENRAVFSTEKEI